MRLKIILLICSAVLILFNSKKKSKKSVTISPRSSCRVYIGSTAVNIESVATIANSDNGMAIWLLTKSTSLLSTILYNHRNTGRNIKMERIVMVCAKGSMNTSPMKHQSIILSIYSICFSFCKTIRRTPF